MGVQHERSTSMICTILNREQLIKVIMPAKSIKIISKQWTSNHENMEKLLMVVVDREAACGRYRDGSYNLREDMSYLHWFAATDTKHFDG